MVRKPFNGFNVAIKNANNSISIGSGSNPLAFIDQNLFLIIYDLSSYK
ncbi:hypothetical protein [Leptospira paudalimensis]|uniref:Uncharacterized protein n=1 Tax=Leptospira paudalimensis TaxID=2950024 RepID=A0ABT3M5R6_9LEPT|nr:hypothetical protein [Leptospira paudalimensis]MCW7503509.1 hypothetical protein [Leptospira paudalimensis]